MPKAKKSKMEDIPSEYVYPCTNCERVADPDKCSTIKACSDYKTWFSSAWPMLTAKFKRKEDL